MASVKVQRAPVRASFTKALNELTLELGKDEKDPKVLQKLFERLQDRNERLQILDDRVQTVLLSDPEATEQQFTTEFESVQEYRDRFIDVSLEYQNSIRENKNNSDEDFETASQVSSITGDKSKRKYKLPKLEQSKFDGNPKEWLSFWSQFQSIHLDDEMADQDKFQYLIQATVEGSKARDVVMSFPASAENYGKAVEYLKERFGKADVLVEVYVRELLRLVIDNSRKEISVVSSLYDRLETQLRALETLGVTHDKCIAILYPMVESCLPEETLKTWERTRHQLSEDQQKDRLTSLMKFLKVEVEAEDRVNLAKESLLQKKRGQDKIQSRSKEEKVPTATDLLSGSERRLCVFCNKPHESKDCFSAPKLALEEKKKKLSEKKACYACLMPGHSAKMCRAKLQCPICQRKHVVTMCPDLIKSKKQSTANKESKQKEADAKSQPSNSDSESAHEASLTNLDTGPVLLQTLIVKLHNENKNVAVRAMIDTGSQRSYVTSKAAQALQLK
jgi:hypothetical protein